jgi:LacI family transcriptional regulator
MPDDPRIRYMTDRGFPFAAHGRTDMGIDHPYFDFDNEAFGRVAVRALAERGRRRLLLVAPPRAHLYARHMTVGFADEAALLGLRFEVAEGFTSDSGGEVVEAGVARRFAAPNPPDGLLVGSTTAAMSAVAGAEQSGASSGRISTWWPRRPSPSCAASGATLSSSAKTLAGQEISWPTHWSQRSRNGLWPSVRGLRFQTR